MNSIGKFPSLLFESAHSPRCLNNQPLNCMLFTCARMSSSSVFLFHTPSSPGARQTTECEWFGKRKSWRRAQGVDHSPCARARKRGSILCDTHTIMLYGERAQSELALPLLHGSRVARMQRVELIQNSMANNCQKNGHSLAGVELVTRNNKKVFSDVYDTSALLSLHNHLS